MSKKSEKSGAESDGIRQLLKHAPGVLGGAAGSVVGLGIGSVGVPGGEVIGSVLGSAAGNLLSGVAQDIWERRPSYREKKRAGIVLAIVINEIQRRFDAGESVRADDFFDANLTGRSDAEEVAESVLLKVQREPEERKLPYMGLLYVSTVFDAKINAQFTHQLTKIAEQLTYRQLCILKLAVVKDKYELRDRDYRDHDHFGKDLCQILYECAELYDKQYINFRGEADLHNREYMDYGATIAGLTNPIPSRMTLQGIGVDIFNLMKLSLIPDEDIAPIAEQLK